MNTERKVRVLADGEGEPVWFLDNLVTVKARAEDGAPFGLMEQLLPKGSRTPLHRHHDEDEGFYLLDGKMTLFLEGDRTVEVTTGAYVHVPRGIAHGFRVDEPVKMLVLTGADGFVEVVREAGVVAPRRELPPPGPPDLARLEAAAKRRGVELLGPLPE